MEEATDIIRVLYDEEGVPYLGENTELRIEGRKVLLVTEGFLIQDCTHRKIYPATNALGDLVTVLVQSFPEPSSTVTRDPDVSFEMMTDPKSDEPCSENADEPDLHSEWSL